MNGKTCLDYMDDNDMFIDRFVSVADSHTQACMHVVGFIIFCMLSVDCPLNQ